MDIAYIPPPLPSHASLLSEFQPTGEEKEGEFFEKGDVSISGCSEEPPLISSADCLSVMLERFFLLSL